MEGEMSRLLQAASIKPASPTSSKIANGTGAAPSESAQADRTQANIAEVRTLCIRMAIQGILVETVMVLDAYLCMRLSRVSGDKSCSLSTVTASFLPIMLSWLTSMTLLFCSWAKASNLLHVDVLLVLEVCMDVPLCRSWGFQMRRSI